MSFVGSKLIWSTRSQQIKIICHLAHVAIPNSLVTNAKTILPTPRAQTKRARKVNMTLCLYPRGTWTIETLEEAMDIVERGHFSMIRASQHWHIPLTFLSNHLNDRTRPRKVGPQGILRNDFKGCNNSGMDTWHATVQTFIYLECSTQNEGGKTYPN
jgi:hypothetical protein